MTKPWDLRGGDVEGGLAYLEKAYAREKTTMWATSLGISYLWVARYENAWSHFRTAIETHGMSLALFYGMAGTARWCMGQSTEAVQCWQEGLRARFADGAGGIHLPMLLLVSSALRPGAFSTQKAEELVRMKAEARRVKNWPGPLGPFILEQVADKTLEELAVWQGSVPPQRRWLIEFYKLILELRRGNLSTARFRDAVRPLTDTAGPEWSKESDFEGLIRNEEFFIARSEGSDLRL